MENEDVQFVKVQKGTTEIKYSVQGAWNVVLSRVQDFDKAKAAFLKTYGYDVIRNA